MTVFKGLALLTVATALSASMAYAAPRGNRSTISFGKSGTLTSIAPKKRNFKQDIDAVAKSHQNWKKAHLNKVLYACQKNGEETATLAKKVAEKMDASKAEATYAAQALAKDLAAALSNANDPSAALLTDEQRDKLREKVTQLENAQKKSMILEHLAAQVRKYYQNDAPRTSPFGGGCPVSYSTALKRGTEASTAYHADTQDLRQKIDGLTKRAKTALRTSVRVDMVAGK